MENRLCVGLKCLPIWLGSRRVHFPSWCLSQSQWEEKRAERHWRSTLAFSSDFSNHRSFLSLVGCWLIRKRLPRLYKIILYSTKELRQICPNILYKKLKPTLLSLQMYLTGMVDKRTLEKYEREAKEKNRETWYLSWCMDTNQEGNWRPKFLFSDRVQQVVSIWSTKNRTKLACQKGTIVGLPVMNLFQWRILFSLWISIVFKEKSI